MLIFALAYLGGVLTIVSPCILPVVPFVFTRADRPLVRGGLPLLVGMTLTFTAVATLAAVGGGWAVSANEYGRFIAMGVLALFGLALAGSRYLRCADGASRALGNRLSNAAGPTAALASLASARRCCSALRPACCGLPARAPCSDSFSPVLRYRVRICGRRSCSWRLPPAPQRPSPWRLLVGGRVFNAMKRSLVAAEWVRRGLGVAVLGAVVAIALGLDTGFLTRVSLASTTTVEQRLIERIQPAEAMEPPQGDRAMTGGPAMSGARPWPGDGDVWSAGVSGNTAMSGGSAMSGGAAMAGSAAMAGGAMMSAKGSNPGARSGSKGACRPCPARSSG